jgi:methylenetetrahydrofolate reductase (NADPH)
VVTAEITPPLSAGPERLLAKAAPLAGLVDGLNVTDAASARATMSSLAAAALLRAAGFDPVCQITCRDRNRIALAGDLLGASAQGIRNFLFLHGDDPASGDQPEAKPVYDLDSRSLMSLARQMRDDGRLPSGRQIDPPPSFFIGGADAPQDPAPDWQPKGLEGKIAAGADFVQTQFCFDLEIAKRYLARLADFGITEKLKIILGIGPIASARAAHWMDENLFGVSVPTEIMTRLEQADDAKAEGRKVCIELMQGLKDIPGVAGLHLMAPGQSLESVAEIIKESGLRQTD